MEQNYVEWWNRRKHSSLCPEICQKNAYNFHISHVGLAGLSFLESQSGYETEKNVASTIWDLWVLLKLTSPVGSPQELGESQWWELHGVCKGQNHFWRKTNSKDIWENCLFHGGKKKSRTQPKQNSSFGLKRLPTNTKQFVHISFSSNTPHGTFFVDQAKRCDGVTARFNYQDPISSSNDLVKQFMYRPNRVGMPKSVLGWESHSESAGCGKEWIFWWVKGRLEKNTSLPDPKQNILYHNPHGMLTCLQVPFIRLGFKKIVVSASNDIDRLLFDKLNNYREKSIKS